LVILTGQTTLEKVLAELEIVAKI